MVVSAEIRLRRRINRKQMILPYQTIPAFSPEIRYAGFSGERKETKKDNGNIFNSGADAEKQRHY